MLLGPYSDCPRLRFNVLSIDYVRVINCFYDYDYECREGLKSGPNTVPVPENFLV